jgi:hypothetical protein
VQNQWPERLLVVERISVIVAALLALFPLLQYWAEAGDRARDRAIREAQLAVICVDRLRTSKAKPDIMPWSHQSIIIRCEELGFLSSGS